VQRPESIGRSVTSNQQLIKEATDAMRFLRTCGSEHGARQADAIQRLLGRFRLYENKLVSIFLMTEDTEREAEKDVRALERRSARRGTV
jgi:hypothetical protein